MGLGSFAFSMWASDGGSIVRDMSISCSSVGFSFARTSMLCSVG